MSDLCRRLGYKERQLRRVLSGKAKIDLQRFDQLTDALVSPWFNGTPFDALHGAALHEYDARLLGPVARARVLNPSAPPRSHVGLDRAVLLAKASSGAALLACYPLKGTSPRKILRQLSLPHRGGSISAAVVRHHKDRPDAEDEKPFALRYHARFDVRVPAFGNRTVAVLRVWPKNRWTFNQDHDVHLTLNGCAFRYGIAEALIHALLHGVAAPDSIAVHSLDVALDVEAPYGALAPFQSSTLPGVGYFRRLSTYGGPEAATGIMYGGPSGHHRVVVYDKFAEIDHRSSSGGIAKRAGHMDDWIACTRFEFRLFPHRLGASDSPYDCLLSMPKVWKLWGVADLRWFGGACPALWYLAVVREAGHLHFSPTAKTVRKKAEHAQKRAREGAKITPKMLMSASERVLYARYQNRSPDEASERDARIFHENACTLLQEIAPRTAFCVGDLIEAALPMLQQQLSDAARSWCRSHAASHRPVSVSPLHPREMREPLIQWPLERPSTSQTA